MLVNKRILTTMAVSGAVTLGLFGAVAVPAALSIRTLKTQIAEEQQKIDRRYAIRQLTRESLKVLDETKDRLAPLNAVAVKEGEELDFIRAVENAAGTYGVEPEITLETVNQKQLSDWEREIPIKLRVRSGYLNALRFLGAIERLPYYVIVDTAAFMAQRQKALGNDIETLIEGTVYWQAKAAPRALAEPGTAAGDGL